jgi:putative transposase
LSVLVDVVAIVNKVVKARVLPIEAESAALEATLKKCNAAAAWLSAQMHAARVYRKYDAQKRFSTELRQRFELSAQLAIRVIVRVADAYTALRANLAAGNYGPPNGTPERQGRAPKPFLQ